MAVPGPLAIRRRTNRLRDPWTNLPRPAPQEADVALDYFQRTFPEVTTEEHVLIRRWEELVDIFGGSEAANTLVLEDPTVLRWPRPIARRSFHYLSLYLGPQVARRIAFAMPYILTRKAGQMRKTLPALLNLFGSKKTLAEICEKYPTLMHIPVSNFYSGMAGMIAVCGSPAAALEVAKDAMAEIAKSPRKPSVPQCWPTLVAVFGGMKEAQNAVRREPLLLKMQGDQCLGKLLTLRRLLGGKENAQQALRRCPFFLHREEQQKSRKWRHAFAAMERIFGTEETRNICNERPELLQLGVCLERALGFAEKKLGSAEAVRDNFESVLRRTGLASHLKYEMTPRPRQGLWTPKMKPKKPICCSWSPHRNPTGWSGVPRGQWDPVTEESNFVEAELVPTKAVKQEQ